MLEVTSYVIIYRFVWLYTNTFSSLDNLEEAWDKRALIAI